LGTASALATLGADADAVLAKALGCTPQRPGALDARGIIGTAKRRHPCSMF